VALYGLDRFLARAEQSELETEARSEFSEGQRLLAGGKPHLAVQRLQRASSLERSNQEYELALASAELADGSIEKARETLNDLLQDDANNASANLLMARAMVRENRFKDADAHYHRAIYGRWPANSPNAVVNARLELADLLAKHGDQQELLSELLLLENQDGNDPAKEKKIAELFLNAGSASRAVEIYRKLVREEPADSQLNAVLGRAEALLGNYRAAHNAFRRALELDSGSTSIQTELTVIDELSDLDPTSRRLSSAEKFRRSQEILVLAKGELDACLSGRRIPEVLKPLLSSADQMQAEKSKGQPSNESAEERLDLAEKLWNHRGEACNEAPREEDLLPMLMKKLSK